MTSKQVAVKVEHLTKSFRVPIEASSGIKQKLINVVKGKKGYRNFTPLNDVSFEIEKGDFFGIVGRNGSGKSTLLKSVAGIYTPNKGHVEVNGSLVPFIELGVGFNFDLTGRENLFLNGALLGFSRGEMEDMYDEIVEFAELADFMDQKLKNYSSGMQVRLAFSIAIRARSDILLLDEVLAVGDENFQRKCNDYFADIKDQNKTVILVTHDMNSVRRYCNRALLIEKGKIKTIGSPEEVANQYSLDNLKAGSNISNGSKELGPEVKNFEVKLLSSPVLKNSENLEFEIRYELNEDIDIDLAFSVVYRGQSVIEHNTQKEKKLGNKKNIKYSVKYRLPLRSFRPSELEIYASIFRKDGFKSIGFKARAITFVVSDSSITPGGLLVDHGEWLI